MWKEKTKKYQYIIIVTSVTFLCGVLLVILTSVADGTTDDLLLNLGTEIIGVALSVLLINLIFVWHLE